MILRTLKRQPQHGYALAHHIKRTSDDLLQIEEGSLYPALQRMFEAGMGQGGVGYLRHQSPRPDLQGHARRRQTPRGASLQLRAHAGGHHPRSCTGETMNFLTQLFQRRRLQQDLSDEIREHLEEKVEELVAGGMSRQDAEFAAHREFGSVTQIEEQGTTGDGPRSKCSLRLSLRAAHVAKVSRIHAGCSRYAGAGYWRQHCDLFRSEHGVAASVAVSRAESLPFRVVARCARYEYCSGELSGLGEDEHRV